MSISINGTDGITFPDASVQVTAPAGTLIGYQVFTATGTYDKTVNIPTFVIAEVVGGGAGSGGSGTCSARWRCKVRC